MKKHSWKYGVRILVGAAVIGYSTVALSLGPLGRHLYPPPISNGVQTQAPTVTPSKHLTPGPLLKQN